MEQQFMIVLLAVYYTVLLALVKRSCDMWQFYINSDTVFMVNRVLLLKFLSPMNAHFIKHIKC
jgi:hypothetical protein